MFLPVMRGCLNERRAGRFSPASLRWGCGKLISRAVRMWAFLRADQEAESTVIFEGVAGMLWPRLLMTGDYTLFLRFDVRCGEFARICLVRGPTRSV